MRSSPSPALEVLLDIVEQALAQDQVPSLVYGDKVIFDAEMRRIFARHWVFVAHESEIPKNGDFVLRRVGLDEVIVTRDSTGKINVLSNHCRHRGARLCQIDSGNATRFRCPYHGWTYKNNGAWAAAPHVGDAYGGPLDSERWALLSAPKIGIHHGFIFTSLSENSKSFEDYLAGARWLLDMIVGLAPGGMRVAAPPERFRVNADWKNGAENFSGDVYHVDVAHFSAVASKLVPDLSQSVKSTWRLDLGSGHGFLAQGFEQLFGPAGKYWGYPTHYREKFDLSGLDQCQKKMVESRPPAVGNLFPNLRYVRYPGALSPGTMDFRVYTSFAQWQPIAPGVMEIWNWMFVWEFETEQEAQESYQAGQFSFASSGVLEPDDIAVWEGVAAAAKSPWHRDVGTTYQFHPGAADRFVDPDPDFPLKEGLKVEKNAYNEAFMLSFWREWLSLMRGSEGLSKSRSSAQSGVNE